MEQRRDKKGKGTNPHLVFRPQASASKNVNTVIATMRQSSLVLLVRCSNNICHTQNQKETEKQQSCSETSKRISMKQMKLLCCLNAAQAAQQRSQRTNPNTAHEENPHVWLWKCGSNFHHSWHRWKKNNEKDQKTVSSQMQATCKKPAWLLHLFDCCPNIEATLMITQKSC